MGYSTWIILCSCIIQSCLSMCPENVDSVAECGNSGTIKYHCQYNADSDSTTSVCAPEVNCSAGTFAALNTIEKQVTCTPCSPEMYQPHAKLSTAFTQPNCDYRKTPCVEGELQCGADSPSQNFKCRCDENLGWRPNPHEGCDCFIKDSSHCACQQYRCRPGEKLTANFTCVPVTTPTKTPPGATGTPGATVAAIILGVLLAIAIVIIITLVILRYRKSEVMSVTRGQKEAMTKSSTEEVEAPPPSSVVQVRNENKRGEQLYNRIKTVFIEAVDPKALLLRIDFGGFSDEKLHQYIEKHAREDGAAELLMTMKRQFPDDWFEKLTTALKHENIGLSHTAEQMEKIRNSLSSETAEMRNSGERVSASEEVPLLELSPPGQKDETVNV